MLVDPFTVVAQIVNFGILVWLLSRFLYGPVTRAMEAREKRIREETDAAQRLRVEAAAEGERYRTLIAAFESEREGRLAELRGEADVLRQEQLRKVRAEVSEVRERWHQALEREKESFLRELRVQVGQGSLEVIRSALEELAGTDLEDRLIERFVERLRAMDAADREHLSAAVRQDGEAFHLRTAFPLSDTRRETLTKALEETFGVHAGLRFDTDSDLVAGVELRAGGLMVAWTLNDHLHTLEAAIGQALQETVGTSGVDGEV